MKKYSYSQEEAEYLVSIFDGRYCNEIIELYKEKFNKDITKKELYAFKRSHNVKNGVEGKFQKGGFNPCPPSPIGHERISYKNGLKRVRIKVAENKWVEKSRYIYEQHYGKIPKNCNIVFLDGNRDNYDINNLKCITKAQHRFIAGNCLYFQDKELNNTSILVAEMKEKIAKKEKENGRKICRS